MRTFPALLAAALALPLVSAQAFQIKHTTTGDKATPARQMAWEYDTLHAGVKLFEQRAPQLAPGAALAFVVPPTADPAALQVQLVAEGRADTLAPSGAGFSLPAQAPGGAKIVTSRKFDEGNWQLPGIAVRSPGLNETTRRLGDLRLGCEVQAETAKAAKTGLRVLFAAMRVFGGSMCKDLPVTSMDAPAGDFDRLVIEDGGRRVVEAAKGSQAAGVKLGDAGWSNDARIRYLRAGEAVQ